MKTHGPYPREALTVMKLISAELLGADGFKLRRNGEEFFIDVDPTPTLGVSLTLENHAGAYALKRLDATAKKREEGGHPMQGRINAKGFLVGVGGVRIRFDPNPPSRNWNPLDVDVSPSARRWLPGRSRE